MIKRLRQWVHEWAATLKIKYFERDLYRELTRPLSGDGFMIKRPNCPYPAGTCNCGNGIGCVNVPVDEW